MVEQIISAQNIFKTYDIGEVHVRALQDLTIDIERGAMVAIMGPSGCGKTTLLNCLSGIDDINSGTIHIENTDLSQLDDNSKTDYRARRMGFIFQFYNLLPVLNAIENIELPLLVSGVRPSEAREQSLKMLDLVGLTDWKTHKPAQLSGGQRQRVTIARALVNNPAIVWADEPTGDLDSQTATEIMDLMKSLNKEQGQTFVIVTHDSGIAKQCNRIIHMRDGQIENEEFT
ncbi:MAG: macrolide ABC transporter ATP-binding protein [Chloroflexi bacterium]|jgi:ABC-type lipoprotein export system ATPase subunit|nr:macrolide ABC transporter ATP-binding protein [Chloroflexota bacterium]MCH2524556.1 ABC transporter ATP-binding protein [Dehalococcoidia bacterium]|tara:strand:- start:3440 stop:4129 length:690 start_codon:yes stop_codon:yes gene_type:complete